MVRSSRRAAPVAVLFALAGTGCFKGVGPEDPPPVTPPETVSVTIEYRQPPGCLNVPEQCDNPVVFFASWMRPGAEFELEADGQSFVHRGIAVRVPVNYPPQRDLDFPYEVQVYDPHLRQTSSGGFAALRLKVGGETPTAFGELGTTREHAKLFIDASGFGHNPE
jgi:hypothetical protein